MSEFNDTEVSDTGRDNEEATNDENEVTDEMSLDDPDLDSIRAKIKEMEEESEKIRQMQSEVENQMNMSTASSGGPPLNVSVEEKMEIDSRSIYVGNVDYGASAEELEAHFNGSGPINRVSIQCDRFSGHPKGFAYIEFADKESVQTALVMDDSLFHGRQIKVTMKRTNRPGISSTNRPPRGRGGRVRVVYVYPGRGRRGRGVYSPRRRNFYSPY